MWLPLGCEDAQHANAGACRTQQGCLRGKEARPAREHGRAVAVGVPQAPRAAARLQGLLDRLLKQCLLENITSMEQSLH